MRTRWDDRKACLLALVLVCLVALFAPTAYASEQRMRFGTLDAFVWTPDDRSPTPWPVVVFSHGVYMCGNQSRFFTEALAAAGYLVIAPNHTDASCRPFDADAFNPSRSPLKPASMWTDADYRDRANDVRSALDALSNDPRLSGQADRTRVALAGHSLGGYTVLGLGGAWPAWRLPRLKAILAMAPYSLPYASSRGLHELDAPVMYQAGSFDPVFTSPLHGSDGAYERSPPPKYYVEFAATSHAGWLDPAGPGGKEIVEYAVAFLDCYVKGMPESSLLRSRQPGLVELRRDVPADPNNLTAESLRNDRDSRAPSI